MKIAPDVDQLMWVLAEQSDRKAVEEFEARFPELKFELAKRVALVSNLRGAGKAVRADKPRFTAPAPQSMAWHRPFALAAIAAALCVLAYGTFFATRTLLSGPRSVPKVEPVAGTSRPEVPRSAVKREAPDATPNVAIPAPKPLPIEPPAYVPKYQQRHSIAIEEAGLLTVLEAIATQTGMQVEVAPGIDDLKISCRYEEATGLEMLRDLGAKFGFTALSQGGNRVLLVPVVDSRSPGNAGPMVPPVKDGSQ